MQSTENIRPRPKISEIRDATVSLHVSSQVDTEQGSSFQFDGPHIFKEQDASDLMILLTEAAEDVEDLLIV